MHGHGRLCFLSKTRQKRSERVLAVPTTDVMVNQTLFIRCEASHCATSHPCQASLNEVSSTTKSEPTVIGGAPRFSH